MLGGLEKKNALVMEVLEHGGLIVAGGEEQLSLDISKANREELGVQRTSGNVPLFQ